MKRFLPYGRQNIDDDDIAAVVATLKSDFLTTGPEVERFEKALAETVGAADAVACSSGTAALHLALLASGVGPGDVVIVPAITFVATANTVCLSGADVVFADVNPDNGLMEAGHLEAAFACATEKGAGHVKSVIPVHLNGQCADLAALRVVANRNGATVIADACHALGAKYRDSEGGGLIGDGGREHATCLSFHPVKTIAMGEGGAVTTNDPELAHVMRSLRHHGMERDPDRYRDPGRAIAKSGTTDRHYHEFVRAGLNYRLSDIHAALGTSQLNKLDVFVARRRALAAAYAGRFSAMGPHVRAIENNPDCRPAWHIYPVLIDFAAVGVERADVVARLFEDGIGTQVHYAPVYSQPWYREKYGDEWLPGAESYYQQILSLPLFIGMEDGDVGTVCDALSRVLGG